MTDTPWYGRDWEQSHISFERGNWAVEVVRELLKSGYRLDVPNLQTVTCAHCAHSAEHPRDTTGWTYSLEEHIDNPSGFVDPRVRWICNGYCCCWPHDESEGWQE